MQLLINPSELLWLAPLALGAGWLLGAVSIGGVLLIPALSFIGGLDIRVAMATALFSFFFTGLAGTVQFWESPWCCPHCK